MEKPCLLFVDDEENILLSLKRLFRQEGYRIYLATSGKIGLGILEDEAIDLVISDMRMPEMNGAEFLEQVTLRWPKTMRILLTGFSEMESTIAAVNKGRIHSYVSKPWDASALKQTVSQALRSKYLEDEQDRLETLVRAQNEELNQLNVSLEDKVRHRTEELQQTVGFLELAHSHLKNHFKTTVAVFSNLLELREGGIAGHARRVAEIVNRIAVRMSLSEKMQEEIHYAALLHDIGKIALPDAVIHKAYHVLSPEEKAEFEKHPLLGQAALQTLEPLNGAALFIRSHHERHDGRGYPDGLGEKQIPMGARILSVVSDYDALKQGMLTRQPLPEREAQQFISDASGSRYDPEIVSCFLEVLKQLVQDAKNRSEDKELCLKSSALQVGMVTTRDIVFNNGILLLSKDHRLSHEMIQNIFKFEIAMGKDIEVYVQGTGARE